MKRNLLSVLILALLIVNIVLTAVMMFSVVGTSRKTSALVGDIASIVQLELNDGSQASAEESVNIEDIESYNIVDPMTIHLVTGEDGKDHYCIVSVSFSVNKKDKDYKSYGSTIGDYESLIKGEIDKVIGNYTKEEAEVNKDAIADEILTRIQNMYDSKFIIDVVFTGWNLS